MKILKILSLFCIIIFIASCERMADTSNPIIYEKNGISFSHPRNWKVTEDEDLIYFRYIIVESPGSALFIAQIYSQQDALSLNEYAEWFSDQAKDATPIAKRTEGKFSKIGINVNDLLLKGIREEFSIKILSLNVPHIADYYRLQKENKVAFLISQSSIEDINKVAVGFTLLIKSFKID